MLSENYLKYLTFFGKPVKGPETVDNLDNAVKKAVQIPLYDGYNRNFS